MRCLAHVALLRSDLEKLGTIGMILRVLRYSISINIVKSPLFLSTSPWHGIIEILVSILGVL